MPLTPPFLLPFGVPFVMSLAVCHVSMCVPLQILCEKSVVYSFSCRYSFCGVVPKLASWTRLSWYYKVNVSKNFEELENILFLSRNPKGKEAKETSQYEYELFHHLPDLREATLEETRKTRRPNMQGIPKYRKSVFPVSGTSTREYSA